MGLWDYEEVAPEAGQSSSSEGSDSDAEQSPSTKRGRRRKAVCQPAFLATPASADDDGLLSNIINLASSSDSDDDILNPTPKKQKTPEDKQKGEAKQAGDGKGKKPAPVDQPEQYLDKDTLEQLKQNDLRKLLEDDLDVPPAGTSQPEDLPELQYQPRAMLTDEDRRALASVLQDMGPEAAATTSTGPASGAGGGGADEDGTKICICLQGKDGKVKIKISPHSQFQKLIEKFRQHGVQQRWLTEGQEIRLMLDGDVLSPDETPADQDLEDDDVVEVRY